MCAVCPKFRFTLCCFTPWKRRAHARTHARAHGRVRMEECAWKSARGCRSCRQLRRSGLVFALPCLEVSVYFCSHSCYMHMHACYRLAPQLCALRHRMATLTWRGFCSTGGQTPIRHALTTVPRCVNYHTLAYENHCVGPVLLSARTPQRVRNLLFCVREGTDFNLARAAADCDSRLASTDHYRVC